MYQTEPPLKQCGRIQIVPYQHEHFKELVVRPHDGSPQIPSLRFSYIKICKFYLKYVREKYKLKRVQAQVVKDYEMLHRFVKYLGFTYEGTLHNYCGGTMDNCMYAIWEGK